MGRGITNNFQMMITQGNEQGTVTGQGGRELIYTGGDGGGLTRQVTL